MRDNIMTDLFKRIKMTKNQAAAFTELQEALAKCNKLGILLVGQNEQYYGLNGKNVARTTDDYSTFCSENQVNLEDIFDSLEYIQIPADYVDVGVYIEVKNKAG